MADPPSGRARNLRPRWVAVVAFLACLLWFYPGDMRDKDTVAQYRQVQTGEFHDTHPVAMAVLWSFLDPVVPGPAPMLLLQVGLYWAAAFLAIRAAEERAEPQVAWAVAALVLAPYVTIFLGEIVKDVQMLAVWCFVAAAVRALRARHGQVPGWALAALVPLMSYGLLVRHNGAVVGGPLLLYLGTGRPFLRDLPRTLLAWGLAAALGLAGCWALPRLVGAPSSNHTQVLLLFDLIGISKVTGEDHLPLELSPQEYSRLLDSFDHSESGFFFYGEQSYVMTRFDESGLGRSGLLLRWLREVAGAPGAYLLHRLRHAFRFFFWRRDEAAGHIAKSVLARPATWVLALVVLLGVRARRELPSETSAYVDTLLATATLYSAAYLVVGLSWGYRLFYPVPAFLTFAGAALLAPGAASAARPGSAPARPE